MYHEHDDRLSFPKHHLVAQVRVQHFNALKPENPPTLVTSSTRDWQECFRGQDHTQQRCSRAPSHHMFACSP